MKYITVKGRLTKDCEVKDTFIRFSMAVDGFENGAKKAEFFDVTVFGKRGISASSYLKKGQEVVLGGDFSSFQADNGRTYFKVKANDIELCGPVKREETEPELRQSRSAMHEEMSDDVPF